MLQCPPSGERALHDFAATRDPRLRAELVERYLPLARHIARRYARGPETFDDLFQVASIGLVKALDRFDPANGAAFSSYAVPTITGELRRHFRDRSWTVRPPRALQERTLSVEAAVERLTRDLGRAPTVDALAEFLELPAEDVLEALEAAGARRGISLSTPVGDGDDGHELGDRFGRPDDGFGLAEDRATLDGLTAALSPRTQHILALRFEQDLTQAEIGRLMGVSQMQVSRILRAALATLRQGADGTTAAGLLGR